MSYLDNTLLNINRAILLVANPGNTRAAKGTDTHTEDTAKNRVSSGNGETEPGGHGEVTGRGDNSADHTEHKQARALVKCLDVDNLGSNSVGNTTTNTKSTTELHDSSTNHGLEVADGAGGNG